MKDHTFVLDIAIMGFGRAEEDRPTPKEVYNLRIYILALCATMGVFFVLFCFTRHFNSSYPKHPHNDIFAKPLP